MTDKTIYYRFAIKDGETVDGPLYRYLAVLKLADDGGSDAIAEAHGRYLSEQENGRDIRVQRGEVRWFVRCGFIPHPAPRALSEAEVDRQLREDGLL